MEKIDRVDYFGSYSRLDDCPRDNRPCYAFIGRSNVGKSSLINMLTGRTKLAHVSKAPGKTQSINYFLVDNNWYLVDLPGYGYAKRSKKMRAAWQKMIERYLMLSPSLVTIFVLLDGRHDLQKVDQEFINWIGERSLPFNIVYTKLDKVKEPQREEHKDRIRNALLEHWESLPRQFETSAVSQLGKSEILGFIDHHNQEFTESL